MRILAIIFFSIAAALSAWLMPNNLTLLPLFSVSIARAVALAIALLFWVASGGVDRWGSSRFVSVLTVLVGVAALSGGCLFIQMTRDDGVPAPFPTVYRVTAALLPICFMAGAFLPSRKLFVIVAAIAPIAGIAVSATWSALNAKYLASTAIPKSKEQLEREALVARRLSDLAKIPKTAELEPLLEFANPKEESEVQTAALYRIENTPDSMAQLSAMLEGDHRLDALHVLSTTSYRLAGAEPEALNDRCWTAAALAAREQMKRLKAGSPPAESDARLLFDSIVSMANRSAAVRDQHFKELEEVWAFLRAAQTPKNLSPLDGWVREAQLQKLPENATVGALLEYTGPSEAFDVRRDALARIGKVPESTAQLTAMLNGPHRLDALGVLAERVDQLPEDLRDRCWQAAGLTAQEMARAIKQGKPPARIEVQKLATSVGLVWAKLGPIQDARLMDLATVRDVVRAAGDDTDKASLAWADKVLAQSAGSPK